MREAAPKRNRLTTGLEAVDSLAPFGSFVTGAVHEILSQSNTPAVLLPILLAKAAAQSGRVIWCDFERTFYPPGVARLGLSLDRTVVLQPTQVRDEFWAVTESLRCKGVAACIAPVNLLSRVQARRLQLAAERGGGIGILLRPASAMHSSYAAATRWLIRPAQGERNIQRWSIELTHGHGGRVGEVAYMELCRETNHVRAIAEMVYRQVSQIPAATGTS